MADNELISSISYTNKDFQSIYPELLDVVKKISNRWDPSQSNESDPGVVLLKLCAIIADKCNYNIDKNILECFPVSVTQDSNARELFAQLGYYMHWNLAASGEISMAWNGEENLYYYQVPLFSMVSNDDDTIVYTIIESPSLPGTGEITTCKVLQGTAQKLLVNGDSVITVENLDNYNRLYFANQSIAENGIFVKSSLYNYFEWEKVDNLELLDLGQPVFRFGVSQKDGSCYLEFPKDIDKLIGDGLEITYISTDGEYGNVPVSSIVKPFSPISATYIDEDGTESTETLSEENLKITNVSAITNGKGKETIDDAYRGYKKTVGTFNTLITLRDYNNAIKTAQINNTNIVSNGFVCDRTNDIQCSYKVLVDRDGAEKLETVVEKSDSDRDSINAFGLKMYVLENINSPSDITTTDSKSSKGSRFYNKTFNLLENTDDYESYKLDLIKDYIDDRKSMQHDFVHLLDSRICMIKNKYPIKCKIIPQYQLTTSQATDITNNILNNIYNKLNARELEFGEDISYNKLYDVIMSSDNRIKSIMLDSIEYNTYAVYYDKDLSRYEEVLISDFNASNFVTGYYANDNFYLNSDFTEVYKAKGTDILVDLISGKCYKKLDGKTTRDYAAEFESEIYTKAVLAGNTSLFKSDNDFTHRLYNLYENQLSDVVALTSNTDIRVVSNGSTTATYTLRDNESLNFYAPSLEDKTTYSSYIKYQYSFTKEVPLDADYMLGNNESITFYWKESDDDNANYRYAKYGEGTIIKPNFTLSTGLSFDNGYHDFGEAYNGVEAYNTYYGVSSGYSFGDGTCNAQDSSNISQIIDNDFVLSGTKSIIIRGKNETSIKNPKKCFWILNDKIDVNGTQMYKLFDGEAKTPTHQTQEYILQDGEYFVYCNSQMTELEILSSGTRVKRSTITNFFNEMTCEAIDIDEVASSNINALDKYFKSISKYDELTLTEMQILTIPSGATVEISCAEWAVDNSVSNSEDISTTRGVELTGFGVGPTEKLSMPERSANLASIAGQYAFNKTYSSQWQWIGDQKENQDGELEDTYIDDSTYYMGTTFSPYDDVNMVDNPNGVAEDKLSYIKELDLSKDYLDEKGKTLPEEVLIAKTPQNLNLSAKENYVKISSYTAPEFYPNLFYSYDDKSKIYKELEKEPEDWSNKYDNYYWLKPCHAHNPYFYKDTIWREDGDALNGIVRQEDATPYVSTWIEDTDSEWVVNDDKNTNKPSYFAAGLKILGEGMTPYSPIPTNAPEFIDSDYVKLTEQSPFVRNKFYVKSDDEISINGFKMIDSSSEEQAIEQYDWGNQDKDFYYLNSVELFTDVKQVASIDDTDTHLYFAVYDDTKSQSKYTDMQWYKKEGSKVNVFHAYNPEYKYKGLIWVKEDVGEVDPNTENYIRISGNEASPDMCKLEPYKTGLYCKHTNTEQKIDGENIVTYFKSEFIKEVNVEGLDEDYYKELDSKTAVWLSINNKPDDADESSGGNTVTVYAGISTMNVQSSLINALDNKSVKYLLYKVQGGYSAWYVKAPKSDTMKPTDTLVDSEDTEEDTDELVNATESTTSTTYEIRWTIATDFGDKTQEAFDDGCIKVTGKTDPNSGYVTVTAFYGMHAINSNYSETIGTQYFKCEKDYEPKSWYQSITFIEPFTSLEGEPDKIKSLTPITRKIKPAYSKHICKVYEDSVWLEDQFGVSGIEGEKSLSGIGETPDSDSASTYTHCSNTSYSYKYVWEKEEDYNGSDFIDTIEGEDLTPEKARIIPALGQHVYNPTYKAGASWEVLKNAPNDEYKELTFDDLSNTSTYKDVWVFIANSEEDAPNIDAKNNEFLNYSYAAGLLITQDNEEKIIWYQKVYKYGMVWVARQIPITKSWTSYKTKVCKSWTGVYEYSGKSWTSQLIHNTRAWRAMDANVDVTFSNSGVTVNAPDGATLSDLTIYSKIDSKSEKEPLPKVLVDGGWKANSSLNIKMSTETPMVLYDGQYLEAYVTKVDDRHKRVIKPSSKFQSSLYTTDYDSNETIESSVAIDLNCTPETFHSTVIANTQNLQLRQVEVIGTPGLVVHGHLPGINSDVALSYRCRSILAWKLDDEYDRDGTQVTDLLTCTVGGENTGIYPAGYVSLSSLDKAPDFDDGSHGAIFYNQSFSRITTMPTDWSTSYKNCYVLYYLQPSSEGEKCRYDHTDSSTGITTQYSWTAVNAVTWYEDEYDTSEIESELEEIGSIPTMFYYNDSVSGNVIRLSNVTKIADYISLFAMPVAQSNTEYRVFTRIGDAYKFTPVGNKSIWTLDTYYKRTKIGDINNPFEYVLLNNLQDLLNVGCSLQSASGATYSKNTYFSKASNGNFSLVTNNSQPSDWINQPSNKYFYVKLNPLTVYERTPVSNNLQSLISGVAGYKGIYQKVVNDTGNGSVYEQVIVDTDDDVSDYYTSSIIESVSDNIYVESDYGIEIDGGIKLDVTRTTINSDNEIPMKLYVYSMAKNIDKKTGEPKEDVYIDGDNINIDLNKSCRDKNNFDINLICTVEDDVESDISIFGNIVHISRYLVESGIYEIVVTVNDEQIPSNTFEDNAEMFTINIGRSDGEDVLIKVNGRKVVVKEKNDSDYIELKSTSGSITFGYSVLPEDCTKSDNNGWVDSTGDVILSTQENTITLNGTSTRHALIKKHLNDTLEVVIKQSIELKLPIGEYVLPVRINCNRNISATVSLTDGSGSSESEKTVLNRFDYIVGVNDENEDVTKVSSGMNYLRMVIEKETPMELTIEFEKISGVLRGYVSFEPAFKYVMKDFRNKQSDNKFDGREFYKVLLDKIILLNKNSKAKFNFAHEVNDEIKIANPLSASSFNDKNHPYNKYMICQLDTSSVDSVDKESVNLIITNVKN